MCIRDRFILVTAEAAVKHLPGDVLHLFPQVYRIKNAVVMTIGAGGKVFGMVLGLSFNTRAMNAFLILFDHPGVGKLSFHRRLDLSLIHI